MARGRLAGTLYAPFLIGGLDTQFSRGKPTFPPPLDSLFFFRFFSTFVVVYRVIRTVTSIFSHPLY